MVGGTQPDIVTAAREILFKWKRPFRTVALATAAILALASLAGCRHAAEVKQYTMRGEIVRVDRQAHVALIKHENIESWMKAMTMEYPVKDDAELRTRHDGDRITATVYVRDLDYWIAGIHREAAPQK